MTVTKEDVAAIRAATSFGVRFSNGRVSLLLRKAQPAKNGYSGDDLERTITAECSKRIDARFHVTYPDGAWFALAMLLRAGDVLVFDARENGNGYVRASRIPLGALPDSPLDSYDALYCDELTVEIGRKGRALIRRPLVLQRSYTPANSARAIKTVSAQWELVS